MSTALWVAVTLASPTFDTAWDARVELAAARLETPLRYCARELEVAIALHGRQWLCPTGIVHVLGMMDAISGQRFKLAFVYDRTQKRPRLVVFSLPQGWVLSTDPRFRGSVTVSAGPCHYLFTPATP